MSCATYELTPDQSRFYDLGRQAHAAGYGIEACNLSKSNPLRAWWVAGHIDRDIEQKQIIKTEQRAA